MSSEQTGTTNLSYRQSTKHNDSYEDKERISASESDDKLLREGIRDKGVYIRPSYVTRFLTE